MSSKELKFDCGITNLRCNMSMEKYHCLTIGNGADAMCAVLDRNQAYLLKLWLEEHLNDWT